MEEDVQGKRPAERKRKFSPNKNSSGGRSKSNKKWGRIFEGYAGSVESRGDRSSPRIENVKALFKYTPANESYRSTLFNSVENF